MPNYLMFAEHEALAVRPNGQQMLGIARPGQMPKCVDSMHACVLFVH